MDAGFPTVSSPPWKSTCHLGVCVPNRVTQCRSVNGGQFPTSGGCDTSTSCTQLDCSNSVSEKFCGRYWNMSPVDGTPCSGTIPSAKFCVKGSCMAKTDIVAYCPLSSIAVRSGSGTSFSTLWTATSSEGFKLVTKSVDWLQLKEVKGPHCGETGWVPASAVGVCLQLSKNIPTTC